MNTAKQDFNERLGGKLMSNNTNKVNNNAAKVITSPNTAGLVNVWEANQ